MVSVNRTSTSNSDLFIKFDKAYIEQSIPARFEQQVGQYPDRLAIKDKNHSFTYTELNDLSNQLAQVLFETLGPEPEPVVLFLDQGSLQVVAIIGVLKAGKFYVPFDPLDPPVRNNSFLTEIKTRLIITNNFYFSNANQLVGLDQKIVNLETLNPYHPAENPRLSLGPESLAYVFFTSGSTGRPKGVLDNHRNILHNVMRYTNSLCIIPEDRLSLIQAPNFSGTVSSLFGALLNGAVICPYNLRQEGTQGLAAWLNDTGITIYHSVPMIFRSFLRGEIQFPSVRLIRLEGDRATRFDVELYKQYFSPTCLLVNGLGTTETGLCRQYFINNETKITDNILPIGYSVEDMEIMLLDESDQEVGKNQIGQIAVKSRYLSLGYWQQPELTRSSFCPDPQEEEVRIYCTGDMGRLRSDGCLEYLGRKDFQLKVRGQRIDPAEVEQALLGLTFIREAVVSTHENLQGEVQLIAYLVCSSESMPSVVEIRRILRQQLQDALIPTGYIFLNSLPLTSNGKIDRSSLPEPEASHPSFANSYKAPQTALEQAVADIWAEVFSLDRVGLNDDFFALGGDSLKAIQILSRLHEFLDDDVEFTILTILDNPRLFDLIG